MAWTTLVSSEELAAHLGDPAWVVFDCRFKLTDIHAGRRAYEAGHIPGARYADLEADLSGPMTVASGRHPLPEPDVLATKLGQWGVDASKQVVAYDDGSGALAARLWWLLRWLGHPEAAVLDGGFAGWQSEGRPLERETPVPAAVRFEARTDNGLWVSTADVEATLGKPDTLLVDARSTARFRGEQETLDPVAGHIPGSVNRPFESNLDPTGRFLPAAQLQEKFAALAGARAPHEVIHSCGSGVTACHNLLAMEIAGLSGSRLYPGSWSEWIRDVRRPIARGD
jgi:thiosulfate/3-mercaptopyruvate sulfurtransferase